MEFLGKKVIVTGANRSMGQDAAIAFAKQGADVAISYRSDKTGAEKTVHTIEALGRKACAFYADFSEMKNVAAFAEQAIAYLGGVDVLVNNAGILLRQPLLELSVEQMQRVFQINTIAPLYLTQQCAANMVSHNSKGCIINISSISGEVTMPNRIGYAASKAAMNKWTKNAALDLAEQGIRINAIAPGVIEAGMNENTVKTDPDLWAQHQRRIPLGRAGKPDDITQMILFLASNQKASWITGKVFTVDGGQVL